MLNMTKDIHVDLVLLDLKTNTPKHTLQSICSEICTYYVPCMPNMLLDRLLDQEEIGSSGIGDGVAIPHLRMHYLSRPFVAFARLSSPIDFNAIDHKPVDLICILLSPYSDGPVHLQRLSGLTRLMKSYDFADKLRTTNDADAVRSLFMAPEGWMLAA